MINWPGREILPLEVTNGIFNNDDSEKSVQSTPRLNPKSMSVKSDKTYLLTLLLRV
jgi:hypothetical protein